MNLPERLVIDASVAAKWFLKDARESDVDLASDILLACLADDVELYAPQILPYEVCGILARACGQVKGNPPRLEKTQAVEFAKAFFQIPIQISAAIEDECIAAVEMSVDYAKGSYDMTYIRLAETLNCQWCTADEQIIRTVPSSFPLHRVLLLSTLR
ncbi:MAG: type II toxin-antitoxin system VapC family toxin [Coleofasciculus sp. B1-GNL1-01]|uniref:type II toxin-antitoxin system VapC family toxin n=1 Tax=Coleofasciculus sp. B1-GNL1-01 TaxID=3068484 RepID=UPI0032FEFF5B